MTKSARLKRAASRFKQKPSKRAARNLTRAVLNYGEVRGLDKNALEKRGIYSATGKELEHALGFPVSGELAVIPYPRPDGAPLLNRHTPFFRVRILSAHKGMKFAQPRGTLNHLYYDPAVKWPRMLRDVTKPLTFVEGEVKAMCANEHGILTIALGGVCSWKTCINGRSVPLPEFDDIDFLGRLVEVTFDSDCASNPQVMAALAAFALELTRRGARVAQVVIPPAEDGSKQGLDDFLVKHGAYAYAKLERRQPVLVLNPADPLNAARAFLASIDEHLIYWAGVFYYWKGDHYAELEDDALRAKLYTFLDSAQVKTKDKFVPFCPTQRRVSEVIDALKSLCHFSSECRAPCWLEARADQPPPDELIALKNGLWHIPTRKLLQHTPNFFNLNALDFVYEGRASMPTRWLALLKELWPNDQASRDTLQEWIGYLLSGDTRQEKIMLFVGPKRAGKGTIARIIHFLLGEENVAAPTLHSLAQNFGLAPLIGKSLATIGDARISGKVDQSALAERLLSISGRDAITIDRKHLPHWTGRLGVRLEVITNEVPRIGDASGALASRFIVLRFTRSFYGHEDLGLAAALQQELPGIFEWALEGLARLRARGHFVQPPSAKEEVALLEDLTSPIKAFLRDHCEVAPGGRVSRGMLYLRYREWCEAHGYHAGTMATFGRDLRAALPELRDAHPWEGQRRVHVYVGLNLLPHPDAGGTGGTGKC